MSTSLVGGEVSEVGGSSAKEAGARNDGMSEVGYRFKHH